jgi:hypothetical protein
MSYKMDWRELLQDLDNSGKTEPKGQHIVQAYQDENFLAEAVSVFTAAGLRRNDGIILIVTKAHGDLIRQRLQQEKCNLPEAVEHKQVILLDAEKYLSKFMHAGVPDEKLFKQTIGNMMDQLHQKFSTIRVYGEMVDILWRKGNRPASIRLEELWNDLGRDHQFSLFCSYAMDPLDKQVYDGSLQEVCAHHSHFIPTRDYQGLEKAVDQASDTILGGSLSTLVQILAPLDSPPTARMPEAQAALFWLAENLPTTAQKVLAQIQGPSL